MCSIYIMSPFVIFVTSMVFVIGYVIDIVNLGAIVFP